jgi:hypothetical protein
MAVFRHFTSAPHAQLRHILVNSDDLTADNMLSLSCLPRLSRIVTHGGLMRGCLPEQASTRMQQQLPNKDAADEKHIQAGEYTTEHRRQRRMRRPPLGPHQQEEMRQQVLEDTAVYSWRGTSPVLC